MKPYFAICTVHICRRPAELSETGRIVRKPEIEVVPAGSTFDAEQSIAAELIAKGRARPTTKADELIARLAEEGVELDPAQIISGITPEEPRRRGAH